MYYTGLFSRCGTIEYLGVLNITTLGIPKSLEIESKVSWRLWETMWLVIDVVATTRHKVQ